MSIKFPKSFPLRFMQHEKDIYLSIVKSSENNKRSLNAEIIMAIDYYLKNSPEAKGTEKETE